jgi:hypothetical protein
MNYKLVMKYIIAIVTLLLFFAATSHAGLYSRQTKTEETAAQHSSLYGNSGGFSSGNSGGLYRSSDDSNLPDPGDRPGTGEGIGQATPTGDGLYVLIACCIFFILVKTFRKEWRSVFQIKKRRLMIA